MKLNNMFYTVLKQKLRQLIAMKWCYHNGFICPVHTNRWNERVLSALE